MSQEVETTSWQSKIKEVQKMDNYTYILYEGIEEILRGTRSEVFSRIGDIAFSTWEDETRGLPKIIIERGYSTDDAGNLVASYIVSYDADDKLQYKHLIIRRIPTTTSEEGE